MVAFYVSRELRICDLVRWKGSCDEVQKLTWKNLQSSGRFLLQVFPHIVRDEKVVNIALIG